MVLGRLVPGRSGDGLDRPSLLPEADEADKDVARQWLAAPGRLRALRCLGEPGDSLAPRGTYPWRGATYDASRSTCTS